MTESTTTSGAAVATPPPSATDLGFFARLTGIIFSPRATFTAIAGKPRWFGMLALVVLGSAVAAGGFFMTAVGQQAFLDMMERRGTTGQAMEMYQRMAPYMGYITFGQVLVFSPIVLLVAAGILLAVFTLAGGGATFKQVFTVVVHADFISLVGAVILLPISYLSGSMISTNLSVVVPMLDERSFVALLLGAIDLFWVWLIMVLSIGLAVIYKRRTGPIAVSLYVLYALIAVVYAALSAARS